MLAAMLSRTLIPAGHDETPRDLRLSGNRLARTVVIRDFGPFAAPEILRQVQFLPGASRVRITLHAAPATVKWNWKTDLKKRRLETSIRDAEAKGFASREELGALQAMMRLYEAAGLGDERLFDLWVAITVEADTPELLRRAAGALKSKLTMLQLRADDALFSQRPAWAASLPCMPFPAAGFPRLGFRGRIVNEEAAAAMFPFTFGNIGDPSGAYTGHRVADGAAVYIDIGNPSDERSQNMAVLGANGQGKSTFLKALVLTLLALGFRVFVLDVDGEYRDLCQAAGDLALWVDHTPGSGRYFDPVRIPPRYTGTHPLAAVENAGRFQAAADATTRTVSLLAGGDLPPDEANAADRAFSAAHAAKGIRRDDPRTWDRPDQPSIRDWYAALKEDPSPGAQTLGEKLWRFFDGMQAHLFGRPESGLEDRRLTVFYVAQAVNSEAEARVSDVKLNLVTNHIWSEVKRGRFQGDRFTAVVQDEFQRQALNDTLSRFTNTVATTIRKYNGVLVLAANRPSVMWETVGGRGMWDNSPFKVLFWMEDSAIRDLQERLDLPEEAAEGLRSFHDTKQFLLRVRDRGWDALKLNLPPEELALYRTRGLRRSAGEGA